MLYVKSTILKDNYLISLIFLSIFWLIFLILYISEYTLLLNDYSWSVFFVLIILIIYILRFINKVDLINLYSLFFMTSLMFIGGRFIGVFLGYDKAPIFEMDFFIYKILNDLESTKLFLIVSMGFISLEIGLYFSYLFFKKNNNTKKLISSNKFVLYTLLIVLLFSLIQKLYTSYQAVILVGYLGLFEKQSEVYSLNIFSFLKVVFLASFGLFLSQRDYKIRAIFIILMIIYFSFDAFLGGRGGLICFLIFIAWYYYDCGRKKISISKVFIYIVAILFFLSSLFNLISLRGEDANVNFGMYEGIIGLIYNQGFTLMVFNESMYLTDYPIIPYFQNFIPGTSFVSSLFLGPIRPYENSFASFISYSLNPSMFNAGFGLGWSFFGDSFRYGMENPILFSLFVICFSIFINYIQINIYSNIYIQVVGISLVSSILFLPRSSLSSVFPLVFYILFIYLFVALLSSLFKRNR